MPTSALVNQIPPEMVPECHPSAIFAPRRHASRCLDAPVYDSRQLANSRSTRETPHGPDRISGTQLRLLRNADRLGDRNLAGAPAMDRADRSGYRAGVTAGSVRRR